MRQKLNMITLGVADIQKAKAFYDGLGWQQSPKSMDDLILYNLGGMIVALYPMIEFAEDVNIPGERAGFSGLTLGLNTYSKEETDQVLGEVAKLGGTIIKPAQEVFWGGYSGYFHDLDGHVFEVAYNPFWNLNEKGDLEFE